MMSSVGGYSRLRFSLHQFRWHHVWLLLEGTPRDSAQRLLFSLLSLLLFACPRFVPLPCTAPRSLYTPQLASREDEANDITCRGHARFCLHASLHCRHIPVMQMEPGLDLLGKPSNRGVSSSSSALSSSPSSSSSTRLFLAFSSSFIAAYVVVVIPSLGSYGDRCCFSFTHGHPVVGRYLRSGSLLLHFSTRSLAYANLFAAVRTVKLLRDRRRSPRLSRSYLQTDFFPSNRYPARWPVKPLTAGK